MGSIVWVWNRASAHASNHWTVLVHSGQLDVFLFSLLENIRKGLFPLPNHSIPFRKQRLPQLPAPGGGGGAGTLRAKNRGVSLLAEGLAVIWELIWDLLEAFQRHK